MLVVPRLLVASCFLISPVATGFLHRSPWMILVLGAAFVPPYAMGKLAQWKAAWEQGGLKQVLLSALVTWPIQCVLVGFLYLAGLGLGSLLSTNTMGPLNRSDVGSAILVMVVGTAAGALIARSEGRPS